MSDLDGVWISITFADPLQIVTTIKCSAIAISHILWFTTAFHFHNKY
jgi:hypothetical protein